MNHVNVTKQNPKLQFKKSTIAKLSNQLLSNKMRFASIAVGTGTDSVMGTVGCD